MDTTCHSSDGGAAGWQNTQSGQIDLYDAIMGFTFVVLNEIS